MMRTEKAGEKRQVSASHEGLPRRQAGQRPCSDTVLHGNNDLTLRLPLYGDRKGSLVHGKAPG